MRAQFTGTGLSWVGSRYTNVFGADEQDKGPMASILSQRAHRDSNTSGLPDDEAELPGVTGGRLLELVYGQAAVAAETAEHIERAISLRRAVSGCEAQRWIAWESPRRQT